MCSFGTKVNERMYALADKVEVFCLPLVVEILEFYDPLEKKLVSKFELLVRDPALVHDSNGDDELAVVPIVSFWK